MFEISFTSEDYPNIVEAAKAKKELEIVRHQPVNTFVSKPVKHFLFMTEKNLRVIPEKSSRDIFMILNVFNYGYILGKRAERAKKARGI